MLLLEWETKDIKLLGAFGHPCKDSWENKSGFHCENNSYNERRNKPQHRQRGQVACICKRKKSKWLEGDKLSQMRDRSIGKLIWPCCSLNQGCPISEQGVTCPTGCQPPGCTPSVCSPCPPLPQKQLSFSPTAWAAQPFSWPSVQLKQTNPSFTIQAVWISLCWTAVPSCCLALSCPQECGQEAEARGEEKSQGPTYCTSWNYGRAGAWGPHCDFLQAPSWASLA